MFLSNIIYDSRKSISGKYQKCPHIESLPQKMIKRFQDICKEIYFEKTEYLYILQRYEIKKNKDRVKNRKSVLISWYL